MLTAGALMPSVQEASQVAGQILPVTSGRLFVAWSRSSARRHWPRQTMSFQSGMRLCSGQPKVWQYGTPQSMQRAAWRWSRSSRQELLDLAAVADPLGDGTLRRVLALVLDESRVFAHVS